MVGLCSNWYRSLANRARGYKFRTQEKEQLESDLQSMGLMAHEVERPDTQVSIISRDHRNTVTERRSEEIRALHDQAAEVPKGAA